MMGGDILAGEADAERLGFLARETSAMALYLGEHFDRALEAPSDDPDAPLLHALALGVRACKIERQEAVGIAIVMFGAGESTAALLGQQCGALRKTLNLRSSFAPTQLSSLASSKKSSGSTRPSIFTTDRSAKNAA